MNITNAADTSSHAVSPVLIGCTKPPLAVGSRMVPRRGPAMRERPVIARS